MRGDAHLVGMPMRNERRSELAKLKNIGRTTEAWLNAAGVFTRADLERLGPVEAYLLLAREGYPVSLNLVYAIEGALTDTHWTALPADTKADLRRAVKRA